MDKIKTFGEYQAKAVDLKFSLNKLVEKHPDLDRNILFILAVNYDCLGLGEEAGEVSGKVKKIIRDKGGIFTDKDIIEIKKEIGDTFWYLTSLCETLEITMEDVATANIEKLQSRHARGTAHGSGDNR